MIGIMTLGVFGFQFLDRAPARILPVTTRFLVPETDSWPTRGYPRSPRAYLSARSFSFLLLSVLHYALRIPRFRHLQHIPKNCFPDKLFPIRLIGDQAKTRSHRGPAQNVDHRMLLHKHGRNADQYHPQSKEPLPIIHK